MKKISVIIPSHNGGRFIKKTLMSVLKQIGNFEVEIIIIDNNSTDDTKAEVYHEDVGIGFPFRNVRFFQEKDRGVMDAWNKGLEKAVGDYICFCNTSDFYYSAKWFDQCLKIFEKHNWVSAVYGMTLIHDEGNKFYGIGGQRIMAEGLFNGNQVPLDCVNAFLNKAVTWNECTGMLRREAVDSIAPFDIYNVGDVLRAQREFYYHGYLSYFLQSVAAVTLKHSDSKTNTQGVESDKEMWREHYECLNDFRNAVLNKGEFDYLDTFGHEFSIKLNPVKSYVR
tara:strand:- start:791 stop:1633 length:843 start_codon:yes stop_codon:yes gene_type:complete